MSSKKKLIRCLVPLNIVMLGASLAAAQAPSPVLLVVIKNENALQFVDPIAKKILKTIPVGEGPHEVEASSDGKLAFVSNYGLQNGTVNPGRTISVIDVAAQKELRRFDTGILSRPHGLFYTGGKLYFTAEGSKLIGRWDPVGNQIDWRLGVGQNRTHLVIFSPDMNRIFTSNIASDTITIIERAPEPIGWDATVIHVGKSPEGIDLSPDGKELWTSHGGDGGVSIIDVAKKKVLQTLNLQTMHSNRLKFTRDGRRVLVSDLQGNQVVVVDSATRKEVKRLNLGRGPEGVLIAPDGVHAYVAINGDNNIAILDLKTLELAGRIPIGSGPDGMAWASRK